MSKKTRTIFIVLCIVFCLSAGTLVMGQTCKRVLFANVKAGPVLYGPENCDGYDLCAVSEVQGTLNGTLFEAAYEADTFQLDEFTFAFKNYGFLKTAHGEVFMEEYSLATFAAPDGYAVHINIVGGAGRYEGATGWLANYANFENSIYRSEGEICWPED